MAKGRMITKGVSCSEKLPLLSDKAFKLFVLLIPHWSSHGKMNGEPAYIKGEVCPLYPDLTIPRIKTLLLEISQKTNVKWFKVGNLNFLHSLNFKEHQPDLRDDRMGDDPFPDFTNTLLDNSGILPDDSGILPDDSRLKVKVKEKVKEKVISCSERKLSEPSLDPKLLEILKDCPHLSLISTGESSNFWDSVIASCEPLLGKGTPSWLNMKIRGWNQWFDSNKSKRSRDRKFLESRLTKWLTKDLEILARSK